MAKYLELWLPMNIQDSFPFQTLLWRPLTQILPVIQEALPGWSLITSFSQLWFPRECPLHWRSLPKHSPFNMAHDSPPLEPQGEKGQVPFPVKMVKMEAALIAALSPHLSLWTTSYSLLPLKSWSPGSHQGQCPTFYGACIRFSKSSFLGERGGKLLNSGSLAVTYFGERDASLSFWLPFQVSMGGSHGAHLLLWIFSSYFHC